MDVAEWLTNLGLGKYATTFAENEIDFEAARHLTDDDLRELGLPMGPRRKILASMAARLRLGPLLRLLIGGEGRVRIRLAPKMTQDGWRSPGLRVRWQWNSRRDWCGVPVARPRQCR